MYVPEAFAEKRIEMLHGVIRQHSFATLITPARHGLETSHLPFMLDAGRGPNGTLIAHMARANPHWRHFATQHQSLVIFQGEHGYISPSWYESHPAVPTWNYVAVHASGIAVVVEDDKSVRTMLAEMIRTYETGRLATWSIADDYVTRMMKGIVAFEIPISRIDGKFKLNQNRSDADRQGVVRALMESGLASDRALAVRMSATENIH